MEKDLDNVVLSVRLKGAEASRFWRIMDQAKSRNPYIDKTNVIRELLGLDDAKVLKETEINHFRHPVTFDLGLEFIANLDSKPASNAEPIKPKERQIKHVGETGKRAEKKKKTNES